MGQGAGASGDATQEPKNTGWGRNIKTGDSTICSSSSSWGISYLTSPSFAPPGAYTLGSTVTMTTLDDKKDITQAERTLSAADEKADHANYERVDGEVARYADATGVALSEAEDARLKKLIDRRVLPIMVFTYFLQALDKGTMSFASIMGIRADVPGLEKNSNVRLTVLTIIEPR